MIMISLKTSFFKLAMVDWFILKGTRKKIIVFHLKELVQIPRIPGLLFFPF